MGTETQRRHLLALPPAEWSARLRYALDGSALVGSSGSGSSGNNRTNIEFLPFHITVTFQKCFYAYQVCLRNYLVTYNLLEYRTQILRYGGITARYKKQMFYLHLSRVWLSYYNDTFGDDIKQYQSRTHKTIFGGVLCITVPYCILG